MVGVGIGRHGLGQPRGGSVIAAMHPAVAQTGMEKKRDFLPW